ncbi:hypothetical protein [Aromatoleum anaerobium]|uniref:Uncharacterized protein n=1 Tax=Aromatoleum anaerobium TaxID=182180 RepID=A0ABX1PIM7_9RHOO|nr:hypothetical protein [Aromatoleum anaerobium]MCK0507674.1 hypothetical protein [Aromatoleum anaerobium]
MKYAHTRRTLTTLFSAGVLSAALGMPLASHAANPCAPMTGTQAANPCAAKNPCTARIHHRLPAAACDAERIRATV